MKKIIILTITLFALTACEPKQVEDLKRAAEEIQRFVVCIEAQDRERRSCRSYPPYRERLHLQKGWKRKNYWHRVRSNPQRRRKRP